MLRQKNAYPNGCGNSLCTMASEVPCHFASASGVTYKSDIFEIKFLNGPAMAATVVRNHAETILGEEHQLAVPCIGTQRPSV
jgi:hypothetical protein